MKQDFKKNNDKSLHVNNLKTWPIVLPTFPVFSFSTNHRLLQPLVLALFFNKNPVNNKKKRLAY